MSDPTATVTHPVKTIPARRAIPSLLRNPLGALLGFADQAAGEVVRLNLGSFRPYLVTHPEHVQRVLRDNAAAYNRDGEGLLWGALRRLFGVGVLSDGEPWETSRSTLLPLFTPKRLEKILGGMGEAVDEAVDELARRGEGARVLDGGTETARIVCTAIMRTFFDEKIRVADAMRIVEAQDRLARASLPRLLVPSAPEWFPIPGDRVFHSSVRTINEIVLPVVRETRRRPDDSDDVVSTLSRARNAAGRQRDEQEVRDDVVAMIATSTDTTISILTWLWPVLQAHPDVTARLREEIDRVVGPGPAHHAQLKKMRYMRMVLDEMIRLYPVGWLIPRRATAPDVLGGVRLEPGAELIISPYVTQRMATFWDRPDVFDPERFAPERARKQHRFQHFPFGGGGHLCIGQHLFYLEAQLIIIALLTRFEFEVHNSDVPPIQMGLALRPAEPVRMTVRPTARPAIG